MQQEESQISGTHGTPVRRAEVSSPRCLSRRLNATDYSSVRSSTMASLGHASILESRLSVAGFERREYGWVEIHIHGPLLHSFSAALNQSPFSSAALPML